MRIRPQQQVTDFMREYMAQKGGSDSPLFSQFLNAIVENISVEADPFFIQRSGTEHIITIPELRTCRARKNLQHQITGTNDVATRGLSIFDFLGAVPPERFHPSLLKNPVHFRLCRSQEFGGNVGGVLHRDMELRAQSFGSRCVLSEAG